MFPLFDLNPHRRTPWITVLIIAANLAITAWLSAPLARDADEVAFKYGFVPLRLNHVGSGQPVVVKMQAVDQWGRPGMFVARLSTNPAEVYPTFLTTMFLHGGWMHVFSNMWILWIFGNNVEDRLGHFLYLCYYLVGGVAATFCHYAVDPHSALPVIGASGAVAAVLGGYAITFPWAKVRTLFLIVFIPLFIDVPALAWLGIWFVTQNLIPGLKSLRGIEHEPVAYWAHIGGFLAGIVFMKAFSMFLSPGDEHATNADEPYSVDVHPPTWP